MPERARERKWGAAFGASAFRRVWLPLVLLAGLAANVRCLSVPFIWDDANIILGHRELRPPLQWGRLALEPVDQLYRPVRSLSFALDFHLFGESARGFHVTHLLYALLSTLAFALLAYRLFPGFAGTVAAGLFAAHPIHLENIAWLSGGRADLLAGIFAAFSFLAAVGPRESAGGGSEEGKPPASGGGVLNGAPLGAFRKPDWRNAARRASSCLLFVLALGSKEAAAVLPFMLCAWGWLRSGSNSATGKARDALALGGIHLAALALYMAFRFRFLHLTSQYVSDWNTMAVLLKLPETVLHYVGLLAFPLRQCAVYATSPDGASADAAFWSSLGVLAVLFAAVWRLRRAVPELFFGTLWFLVFLAPVSNLIPIATFQAERFLYLPSFGMALAAGGLFDRAARRRLSAAPAVALAAATVAAFAALSFVRTGVWTSPAALWADAARCAPDSPLALNNHANNLLTEGRAGEAISVYERALSLDPDQPIVLKNLGLAFEAAGLTARALEALERAWALDDGDPEVGLRIAHLYERTGNFREAAERLRALAGRRGIPRLREEADRIERRGAEPK